MKPINLAEKLALFDSHFRSRRACDCAQRSDTPPPRRGGGAGPSDRTHRRTQYRRQRWDTRRQRQHL